VGRKCCVTIACHRCPLANPIPVPDNRYYHERFLRSRPDLSHYMLRTRVKGTGVKAAPSPDTEPDFYDMDFSLDPSNTVLNILHDLSFQKSTREKNGANVTQTEKLWHPQSRSVTISSENIVTRKKLKRSVRLKHAVMPSLAVATAQETIPSFVEPIRSLFNHNSNPQNERVGWPDCDKEYAPAGPTALISSDENVEPDTSCELIPLDDLCDGDVAFFEGHPFFYLDHVDLDELHSIMAGDEAMEQDHDAMHDGDAKVSQSLNGGFVVAV
jgi:hypothetical protein